VSDVFGLEKHGFCNASFSLLPRRSDINVCCRRCQDYITAIKTIQQGTINYLEDLQIEENPDLRNLQTKPGAPIFALCKSSLSQLRRQIDTAELPVGSILIIGRALAPIIDPDLLSYTGLHSCRSSKTHLHHQDMRVLGATWKDNLFNFRYSLTPLACLRHFLDKRGYGFSTFNQGARLLRTSRSVSGHLDKMDVS